MMAGVLPLVKPMVFAGAEALPLVILQHFALHHQEPVLPNVPKDDLGRQLAQARLEHSKVEAHHSQLECPVSPKLAFAYLARSVARLVHSPHQAKCCQGQYSSCHSVHLRRYRVRQHLDQVKDC